MTKILVILLYPAGIAVIVGTGIMVARRSHAVTMGSASARVHTRRWGGADLASYTMSGPTSRRVMAFLVTLALGMVVLYGLMVLLGLLVVHAGPTIDKPIFDWMAGHRIHVWRSLMKRATEVGDKYPTWAAAATAAVCLAVTWSKDRWIPPVSLGALIVVDHFLTLAINHTVTRTPPPGAGGIFPSGGTDRAVVFYGLIAYLLWREFSGRRQTAIIAGAVVAALGFEEGYTRVYLGLHWFTDTVSGFILWLSAALHLHRRGAPHRGPRARSCSRGGDRGGL